MSDYSATLNLPRTDFPMKASLAQREPERLKHWQTIDAYGLTQQAREGSDLFLLHDGPPYANGDIHLGHAVNKVLKDIVVRSRCLSGYQTPYVPGWDCHGLPIELRVEKKKGKVGEKLQRAEFHQACRDYAHQQIANQREAFQRLGILGAWNEPYLTMNAGYEADIIRALAKIIANGHLQRGAKPVHWCVNCGSALAEAEVEYKDKTSAAIDVRFDVAEVSTIHQTLPEIAWPQDVPVSLPIWTTTSWTLPANQAVAVNEALSYQLWHCQTEQGAVVLVLAEALADAALERYGCADSAELLGQSTGSALLGLQLQHPFYPRQVPVLAGEHVTVDAGTGAVHTAPVHGLEDYTLGLAHDLDLHNPVGGNGVYKEDTPELTGQHVFKAHESVMALVKASKTLLCEQPLKHSYPHCWRHKTPLIFRATPQWFISMDANGLREQALAEIDKVQWIPGWGKARIYDMIAKRPDWCISRQRTWGTPMALFVHKETDELHPDTVNLMEKIAQRVEKEGLEAWHQLDSAEFLGADAEHYRAVPDTLDVWFDSGVSHFAVLQQREELGFPADIYLEGSDQHRGWFHSSLLTAVAMEGKAPYKAVLTHGYTVDQKGHKMSKSLGNVIAPEEVIRTLGADILRWWIASTDYQSEITVSDEILQRAADAYRRVRNTARFLLGNLADFDPKQHQVSFDDMVALDQWALTRAAGVQTEVQQAYNDYQFYVVCQKVLHFCSIDMGSFYLDIIKDRVYTLPVNSPARRSAQTAMYHILEALLRWVMPVLCFTADEINAHAPGQRAPIVFTLQHYTDLAAVQGKAKLKMDDWAGIMQLRDVVNRQIEAARKQGLLGSGLEASVTIYADAALFEVLTNLEDELRFVLITSEARLHTAKDRPDSAVETALAGCWVAVEAVTTKKCERCWHRREDVGQSTGHPGLCGRCLDNSHSDTGEVRRFA